MKKLYFFAACLLLSSMTYGQFIINEVLYDPSNNALDGDANGDGTYDQEADSFIEFVNTGTTDYDASGLQIWDDVSSPAERYIIPPNTIIAPGEALVVFGGQTPTGNFGGATVLVADTAADGKGLSLNNSGEIIVIRDAGGNDILRFNSDSLSNNPNESYTRYPDLTGEFLQHGDTTSVLFSPGTQTDGSAFGSPNGVAKVRVDPVTIYPNPVIDELRLQTTEVIQEIQVYALSGQVMLNARNTQQIDVSALPSGAYFIQVQTPQRTQVLQFVKK